MSSAKSSRRGHVGGANHVLLPTESESEESDDDRTELHPLYPDKHPLDSHSPFNNCLNSLFQFWVYKIVQKGAIKFHDITTMPKQMQVHHAYKIWKQHSSNRSTLSTIWSVHKHVIIGISYYIFINRLFPVFASIQTHNLYSLLPGLTTCAVYLFLLLMLSTILETWQKRLSFNVQGQVSSCLYLSIYDKTLSLDINESDKQQVVSIIGSDIPLIDKAIVWVCGSVLIISALILAIIALYVVMGISALFALLFLIVLGIPFQLYYGTKYSHSTKEKLMCADRRVQLISQLMRGIRLLKVSCYELPLIQKIKEYRVHEAKHMVARDRYMAVLFLSNLLIPILMFLIALAIYHWGFGNEIDSTIILCMVMLLSVASIAVRGGTMIGFATLHVDSLTKVVTIDMFAVDNEYQRHGFATVMICLIKYRVLLLEKRRYKLMVSAANDVVSFWNKHSFVHTNKKGLSQYQVKDQKDGQLTYLRWNMDDAENVENTLVRLLSKQ
eukprot:432386_1